MKTRFLIIIAISIFLALIIFIGIIYSINLEFESQLDSLDGKYAMTDNSPAISFLLQFNSIFVAGPIMAGIISLIFLVPNIILRIKKIPTRKYMLIIASCILIFFGAPWIQNGLSALTPESFEHSSDYRINLIGALIPTGIGLIFIIPAIIILKKAKLRKKNEN